MKTRSALLVFTGSAPSLKSASGKRMLAISRGLSEHGVRVFWISPLEEARAEISGDPLYEQISFIRLANKGKGGRAAGYILRLAALCKLGGQLKRLRGEYASVACFTVGGDWLILTLCARIMRKRGIKVLHERTEYPWLGVGRSWTRKLGLWLYYRCFISRVDHLFVISEALKQHFAAFYENRELKTPVDILRMMVETDRIERNTDCPHPGQVENAPDLDITYIGSMYGDKDGVDCLIKAFFAIREEFPAARLVLVGDISCRDRLRKIGELLDLDDPPPGIIFTGEAGQQGVFRYLRQACCLVLSRPDNIQARYGFPTKLGEYLASGKPVVVTKVGDIPRYLGDGHNAYLAAPDSVESFATKLRECLADPERAAEVGLRGRETARREFSHTECVKAIMDAL